MSNTDKIHDLIYWVCAKHRNPSVLSKARMTKLAYLADWKMAEEYGQTITEIDWEFNHYGPYVPDVVEVAMSSNEIAIESAETMYGTPKEVFRLLQPRIDIRALTPDEAAIIDQVIDETRYMSFAKFIDHVYDTFPVKNTPRYNLMNLPDLAARASRRRRLRTRPQSGPRPPETT